MSYQITLSNGSVLVNVPDNATDNSTSLTLVGKNFLGYGTAIADNFVRLLESGANTTPVANPLVGQLWFNTATLAMNVWTGAAWVPLAIGVSSVIGHTGAVSLANLVGSGVAPLASPLLTGVPQAPTAASGTNTEQIASTAFVQTALQALRTGVVSVVGYSGVVTLANLTTGGVAPLASPQLTGLPTAPTAPVNTSTTQLATTAFVVNQITAESTGVISVLGNTGVVTLVEMTNGGLAPIASPKFTGIPQAATAAAGTSTNQLATTAFVNNAISSIPNSPIPPRIRLPGALDLYVSTSGNDNNNGTSLTTAFRTLQQAWNIVLYKYDLNGFACTIHVADGTYGGVVCSGSPPGASLFANLAIGQFGSSYGGLSAIRFVSLSGNANNCIVSTVNQSCFLASFGAQIDVDTFTLQASGGPTGGSTNGSALVATFDGYIGAYNCNFGPCGNSHMEAYNGLIGLGPTNAITGGAINHLYATRKGSINAAFATINIVGTPTFSGSFAVAEFASFIEAGSMTFNNGGSVTGGQYLSQYGGIINTDGNNPATYFPGNGGVVDATTFGLYT